jgi:hypothetical protein
VTEDWRVDDLALCVSRHDRYPPEVRLGAIFRVSSVLADMPDLVGGQPGTALKFRDVPDLGPRAAYCARRFRKITPSAPDDFDEEVIDLLAGAGGISSRSFA